MKRPTPQHPELLAPAGSLEAFFAAMENGADAVYLGLKEFSARAKAKNITLAELERMLGWARARQRRIYVTLNTLVKEEELPRLCETLADLEALRVDGIILQDPAVWRLARQHFPGLELHASTQLTVHNVAGVKMLERMGFSRAVLARELTLAEIAAIRRSTAIELEHFIHGALCFCFSGQCYFSSWLGGKSGNRGRCAQPCRRRYRYGRQDGYWFSPNDLSAIDLLPDLAAAGVCSFKIEGRMKSAEYVANVVGAYRRALDAPQAERATALKEAKEQLKLSFGRPPTKGFLAGSAPVDIVAPHTAGATGRFLGELSAFRDGCIVFKSRDKIHLGDRLRIQPQSDQAGVAFTVKELRSGRNSVKQVAAATVVTVPTPFPGPFRPGDAVYKVSSEQAFTLSEAACRRRLEGHAAAPASVVLDVALHGATLTLRASAEGVDFSRGYEVTTYPAEQRGLDAETLTKVFDGGEASLALTELRCVDLPAVVIPPSRLKEIRRDFYREFARQVRDGRRAQRDLHLRRAKADLLPDGGTPQPKGRKIDLVIGDGRDLHALNDPLYDRIVLPLTAANAQGALGQGRKVGGREKRIVWDIPFILLDPQWQEARSLVRALHQRGFATFRLNNLGHFPLFDGLDGVRLIGGTRLFSLSSQARLAWKELGIGETTLYIEDDRDNLAAVLCRDAGVEASLTVYASIPLLTSRVQLKGVKSDTPLLSDRGEAYRVQHRDGLMTLRPEADFSLLGRLGEVERLGVGRLVVDLAHCGPFSPRGKQVVDALRRGGDVHGALPFNFEHGME